MRFFTTFHFVQNDILKATSILSQLTIGIFNLFIICCSTKIKSARYKEPDTLSN